MNVNTGASTSAGLDEPGFLTLDALRRGGTTRKGTNVVGTNGVTANLMLLDRGTFWALPLNYFYLPKSARAYLFLPI